MCVSPIGMQNKNWSVWLRFDAKFGVFDPTVIIVYIRYKHTNIYMIPDSSDSKNNFN